MAVKNKNLRGAILVELLIVITVIVIGLVYLSILFSFSIRSIDSAEYAVKATFLAQELLEGARSYRDRTPWDGGLGSVSLETPYHLEKSFINDRWKLVFGTQIEDGFERKIIFSSVQRDLNDDIVESGGSIDPNTKKATAVIGWTDKGTSKSLELVAYFTNWNN